MNRIPCFAIVLMVGTLCLDGVAQAAEISFARRATPEEIAAVGRDVGPALQAARRANMPVDVWAGIQGTVTAIRIESQMTCGSLLNGRDVGAGGACQTLVYQGLDRPPVWRGLSGEGGVEWPPR